MKSAQYDYRFACPFCGYQMDATTGLGDGEPDDQPKGGDVSLCLACGEPTLFVVVAGRLTLRVLTPSELDKVIHDPLIARTLSAWRHARASAAVHGDRWPKPPSSDNV
jgi:hypothetical protein